MDPGRRDKLVKFQRPSMTTNALGQETEGLPADIATAWVRIRYGTGQERREAAQEHADQAATFEADWTPTLATVKVTDTILFNEVWDIVSIAPIGLNKQIHYTAVRTH